MQKITKLQNQAFLTKTKKNYRHFMLLHNTLKNK